MQSNSRENQAKLHSICIQIPLKIKPTCIQYAFKFISKPIGTASKSIQNQSKVNPNCIGMHSKPMDIKPKCIQYAFKWLSTSIETVSKSIQNQLKVNPNRIGIHLKPMEIKPKCIQYAFRFLSKSIENAFNMHSSSFENQAKRYSMCIQIPLKIKPICIAIHSKPMEKQAEMHSKCIQIPLKIN